MTPEATTDAQPEFAGTDSPLGHMVDLSHPLSYHTPGWVGYPGMKLYYVQTLQTNRVVAQRVETSLHVGTHIDAPLHFAPGGADMASFGLDRLVREGVVVDISDSVGPWDEIKPHHITDKIEVKRGDIVLYHTGFAKHYLGGSAEDLTHYMCRHPGGGRELAEWIVEMDLSWTGSDTGSADHPMNTTIKNMRPDERRRYEKESGHSVDERWPDEDLFVMHAVPFAQGIVHAENVGGELERLGTRRCTIGAFPWRFVGGEASICRIVAFLDG
jgi:kynurenine formamidase